MQKEYEAARGAALRRFESEKTAAEEAMHTAHWEATALAEAAKGGAGNQVKEIQAQLEGRWRDLQTIHQQAVALLEQWGQWRDFAEPQPTGSLLERHPARRFAHALDLARAQYRHLAEQIAPRFFLGVRPIGIFLLLWAAAILPAGSLLGWREYVSWLVASGARRLGGVRRAGRLALCTDPAAVCRGIPDAAADAAGGRAGPPLDARLRQERLPAALRRH